MLLDLAPLQTVEYLSKKAKESLVALVQEDLTLWIGTKHARRVTLCPTCTDDAHDESFGDIRACSRSEELGDKGQVLMRLDHLNI